MNESFSADRLAGSSLAGRPGRAEAATLAASTGMPSTETEEWRYSPIGDLPLDGLEPVLSAQADPGSAVDSLVADIGSPAATVRVVDGFAVAIDVDPGWASKGLSVEVDSAHRLDTADIDPTVFDHLHDAFSPGAVRVTVPDGLAVEAPVVIDNQHRTSRSVVFPHLTVTTGAGAKAVVAELQTSADGAGLSVPVTELSAGASSDLRYAVVQRTEIDHWLVGRQVSSIDQQANLVSGMATLGGRYCRTRTDSRLVGRGANATLVAAYYGDGDQIHDFRTFQHHEARDTRSDLLFKGTQDGSSGSIYTGLIHIHEDGAGSNAFQTNRNVKLSDDAWAWSVPNLEIENNDVRCSHASTVSPVDDDQRFFLHTRGVPPSVADWLIVSGFFAEVTDRLPVDAVRRQVRDLINAKLDERTTDA